MARKQSGLDNTSLILLVVGLISCAVVYTFLSVVLRPSSPTVLHEFLELGEEGGGGAEGDRGGCYRGIENLELWGSAVKWGSEFKFNSSEDCCKACKAMCSGNDGPCLCDSWVFCGNRQACGSKFGECWLKKQKDTLAPERQNVGQAVIWTSGLIFGKGEGIVGLETGYGTLHIKVSGHGSDAETITFSNIGCPLSGILLTISGELTLSSPEENLKLLLFPDCAPHSVAYILELLTLRHCAGCEFYRAEGRGDSWDSEGNHIENAPLGPPFALIQGTLEPQGTTFKKIPTEACPIIRRGSVAWIGSGPEFFISLANHEEWKHAYTVFGSVLPEDMEIAEKIVRLPTKSDVWNNINVSVLENPVSFSIRRIKRSTGDLNTNVNSD